MSSLATVTHPPPTSAERLGSHLIAAGKLSREGLESASRLAQTNAEHLGLVLVKLGLVSERDLAEALAALLELPLLAAGDYPVTPLYEEQVSAKFLKTARAIPVFEQDDALVVAMAMPEDTYVIEALELACGRPVRPAIGVTSEILAAVERLFGTGKTVLDQIVDDIETRTEASEQEDIERLKDLASEAPIVRLVNHLINRAIDSRASDIHIEPFENRLKVRYRIDGVLHEVESPPARSTAAVISRVKIMAKLNIAERRLPQDGRIQLRVQGKEIDLRISTVPTLHGESVVMRVLDKQAISFEFQPLGFSDDVLKAFLEILDLPHGVLLVTGPTGSGKTSTLYAALKRLNTPERKLLTVEDPVEYQLEGINQIQVKPQIGLNFANALRSIVRQDPDVIMIGEIRDLETAEIAVQSALTGHLVLSTLHTNDAGSSVTRLLDMGVEDYLLTSTVNGVLAQRLVRTLCMRCRRPYEALPEIVEELKLRDYVHDKNVVLYEPVGCPQCAGTGFRGRTAVLEFLCMTDPIRRLVLKRADAGEIQAAAIEARMRTMFQDGVDKALRGITAIEEVLRVTNVS
ncbi:MAG: type II secretion system ATPase GspE [Gammaproteobacteria bacterium]